uniref:Tim10-like domain-containing protein n=1 Tax=Trichobilharzia regenti TaxID=157069 RepID=A0AA85K2F2_TRIRE|nr:unnamed protein product [Trichobilharzia regenti]
MTDEVLQRQLLQELQKQRFQQLGHQLTSICWDKCVSKLSSSLDSRTESCLVNCVERYIDVSGVLTRRQNETRLGFVDMFISSARVLRCSIGSAILSVPLSRCLSSKTDPEFGITNIQDDNDFQKRVLENPAPVLVDFHAKCIFAHYSTDFVTISPLS